MNPKPQEIPVDGKKVDDQKDPTAGKSLEGQDQDQECLDRGGSRRKMVSPSFIRSNFSRAKISR